MCNAKSYARYSRYSNAQDLWTVTLPMFRCFMRDHVHKQTDIWRFNGVLWEIMYLHYNRLIVDDLLRYYEEPYTLIIINSQIGDET